jgi:hypothetical protein
MATDAPTCPMTQRELVDEYFMEHRTKILDLAAFLDRLERARERDAEDDFRLVAVRGALAVLAGEEEARVERIQMILSDQRTEPLPHLDQQSAKGAYDPAGSQE